MSAYRIVEAAGNADSLGDYNLSDIERRSFPQKHGNGGSWRGIEGGYTMETDWKTALRRLAKTPPSERTKSAVLDCMRGTDSDRAAALIIGSLVETGLRAAIVYALGHHDRGQTFASQIRTAQGLNLIGTETFENLETIREVRNTFAHAMSAVEFAAREVTIACNRLVIADNHKGFVNAATNRQARFQFGYASQVVFSACLNFAFTRSMLIPDELRPAHRYCNNNLSFCPIKPAALVGDHSS